MNPITLRLFTDARERGVRLVYTGDEHQHIYSFNGSRNFLATLPADQVFRLTRTFRFSSSLAAMADKILSWKGERCPVRGARGVHTTIVAGDKLPAQRWMPAAALPAPGGVPAAALPAPHRDSPTTVICRTNVSWLELAASMSNLPAAGQAAGQPGGAAAGKKLYIYTPDDATRWCDDAIDLTYLCLGQRHKMQGRFKSKSSFKEVFETAQAEGDVPVQSLCALVLRVGASNMIAFIVRIQDSLVWEEEEAAVLSGTRFRTLAAQRLCRMGSVALFSAVTRGCGLLLRL